MEEEKSIVGEMGGDFGFFPDSLIPSEEFCFIPSDASGLDSDGFALPEESSLRGGLESETTIMKNLNTKKESKKSVILASSEYNVPSEGLSDEGVFQNMLTAQKMLNDYFKENTLKPVQIKEGESLINFLNRVYDNQEELKGRYFRYLEAVDYFDNSQSVWVYPNSGGIEAAGACDIATLLKRVVTFNFEKIGQTETYMGHTVERWGSFVIVYLEHTPYPKMAPDMIAVSSWGKYYSGFMDSSNSEFLVFLVDDGEFSIDTKMSFKIDEENSVFRAELISTSP